MVIIELFQFLFLLCLFLPVINGKDHLINPALYFHRKTAERFKSAKKRDEKPIGAGDKPTKED